jgi:hypothetical protein
MGSCAWFGAVSGDWGYIERRIREREKALLCCLAENWTEEGELQCVGVPTSRALKQTVVIIRAYHFCQLCTKIYPVSCCQGWVHMQRKLLGIINVDFDTTIQLLIIYSAFNKYLEKKWEYSEAVYHLFIDVK